MNAVLRIATWLLALALVVMPVVAVLNGWVGADRFPLRTLRVHGELKRVDDAQLHAALLPYARAGFFAVKLDAAQAAVRRLPWVDQVDVRKQWPDVMEVTVVEHQPFARWGDHQMLSQHGRLFAMPKDLATVDLPQLGGPDGQVTEVVGLFNESRAMFAPMGLGVESLVMDPRGSWSLRLDTGLEIVIGRNDAKQRLERFARLLPQLQQRDPAPLRRADLRYTNGFALAWGDLVPAPAAPAVPHAPAAEAPPPAALPDEVAAAAAARLSRDLPLHAIAFKPLSTPPATAAPRAPTQQAHT